MRKPRILVSALLTSILLLAVGAAGAVNAGLSRTSGQVVTAVGTRNLAALTREEEPSPVQQIQAFTPPVTPDRYTIPLRPDPVRIQIPSLQVDTSVQPVGLTKNGELGIPKDITRTGWYMNGPPPGSYQGSSVIVAHRDGAVQGHGVFYSIGSLGLGDIVKISDSTGTILKYHVVARELLDKDKFTNAAPDLFSNEGPPRLTLISCGGHYDRAHGGYQSNIIVTATPVY